MYIFYIKKILYTVCYFFPSFFMFLSNVDMVVTFREIAVQYFFFLWLVHASQDSHLQYLVPSSA